MGSVVIWLVKNISSRVLFIKNFVVISYKKNIYCYFWEQFIELKATTKVVLENLSTFKEKPDMLPLFPQQTTKYGIM